MVTKFRIKGIAKSRALFLFLLIFYSVNIGYAASVAVASKEYVDSAITTTTEVVSNKVKSVAAGGSGLTIFVTDDQYPSAKVTYAELSGKMVKIPDAASGNIAIFDGGGQAVDSGYDASDFQNVSNRLAGYIEITTPDQYYSATAVNSIMSTKVGLISDQTIGGIKTFMVIPMIPTAALPSL